MSGRPRVLVIAESCNPQWVSVPLLGWLHAQALRAVADVHLVTQIRNRDPVRGAGLVEGRDFTAIDSEAVAALTTRAARKLRGGRTLGWTIKSAVDALHYPYFESLVWKQFGARIRRGEFDIVHRLKSQSPTQPSPIAVRCRQTGVPFVWGPINGGAPWPKEFSNARRAEREWLSYLRDAHKLLPLYHSTRANSSAILIGSRHTWQQMPRSFHHRCFYMPENAVDPTKWMLPRTRHPQRPVKAVFVGRLVPYKGADMLLEAAAPLLQSGELTLDLIGDGPQLPQIRSMIDSLSLQNSVHAHGWMDHARLPAHLASCDLFTFPSVREFGGGVVLEAMAAGAVPVVVDYAGPAELVTPECGYLIPLGNRQQIVQSLRQTLSNICAEPMQLVELRAAAQRRVIEQFTWVARATQTRAIYDWLLENGPKPVLNPQQGIYPQQRH